MKQRQTNDDDPSNNTTIFTKSPLSQYKRIEMRINLKLLNLKDVVILFLPRKKKQSATITVIGTEFSNNGAKIGSHVKVHSFCVSSMKSNEKKLCDS